MKQELGYTCPQTKKQCDDECCVSAEDCHAEAINNIISNCEPEQLNQNKMKQELGYTCPQTKKQCDDECCVSAEDCHAEAINNIISNCEPEQLNQNKMKQTAVDWLVNELQKADYIPKNSIIMNYVINQAKEIEKQQIIDFALWFNNRDNSYKSYTKVIEQYYNETFKNK